MVNIIHHFNSYFDCQLTCQKDFLELQNNLSENEMTTDSAIINTTTEDDSNISIIDADKNCHCGHSNLGRIVNGQNAPEPGSFPWQIILRIRNR